MRVTHVINGLATGGAEHLVVNLCAALRQRGVDASIATLTDAGGIPSQRAHEIGIPVKSLAHARLDPRALRGIRSVGRESDLVHVHLFPALYWTALALAGTGAPWIYTEHSTGNRRREVPLWRPYERLSYKSPSHIVAISRGVESSLRQYLRGLRVSPEISVIHNGIADAYYLEQKSRETTTSGIKLLAVGTLDSRKNFRLALEVVAAMPEAELVILGSGPQLDELQTRAVQLRIADRVKFRAATSQVRQYMDESTVLLITSVREGFSLVAAEAMARGLPVVAPRLPGLREVMQDGRTGALFDVGPNSAIDAVHLIRTLVQEPDLYRTYSRNAVEASQRFSIKQTADRHIALYRRIASVANRKDGRVQS